MRVKRSQCRDHHEIRQDKGPAAGPGAPEAAAQIGDEDPDLDGERPRQGLADGDGVPHLLAAEPALLCYEFLLHQTDERHRPAETHGSEPQEIADELGNAACRCRRDFSAHALAPRRHRAWSRAWTETVLEKPGVCAIPTATMLLRHAAGGNAIVASSRDRDDPARDGSAAQDKLARSPPLRPTGALQLRPVFFAFGISEAEITDEAPVGRHFENSRDARRIQDRDPAHADALDR